MTFNFESAAAARAQNPHLTKYDTGEQLEPRIAEDIRSGAPVASGLVHFDNDESATVFSVEGRPSGTHDETTVVKLETVTGGSFEIILDDRRIFLGNVDEPPIRGEDDPLSVEIPTRTLDGTTYTDLEGITDLLNAWLKRDPIRRAWSQDGDDEDAIIALSWADEDGKQAVSVRAFDQEADAVSGCGWSVFGLPFEFTLSAFVDA